MGRTKQEITSAIAEMPDIDRARASGLFFYAFGEKPDTYKLGENGLLDEEYLSYRMDYGDEFSALKEIERMCNSSTPKERVVDGPLGIAESVRGMRFDSKNNAEIADYIYATVLEGRLLKDKSAIYIYNENTTLWNVMDIEDFEVLICTICRVMRLKVNISSGFLRTIMSLIIARAEVYIRNFYERQTEGTAFNTTIILTDGTIRPLTKEDRQTEKYSFDVIPGAPECVELTNYLRSLLLKEEEILTIKEYIGMCLLGAAYKSHKMIFLLGPGANGKGTFIEIVLSWFHQSERSSICPEDFDKPYRAIGLLGKKINMSSELSANAKLDDVKNLKAITSGDQIEERQIYKGYVSFSPRAGHIFSCNELPHGNASKAYIRRVAIIPFRGDFPVTINTIKSDLDKVKQQCISDCIAHGIKAIRQGGLSCPSLNADIIKAYKEDIDVLERFAAEVFVSTSHLRSAGGESTHLGTKAKDMYKIFEHWSDDETFGEAMRTTGYHQFVRKMREIFGEYKNAKGDRYIMAVQKNSHTGRSILSSAKSAV